MFKKIMSQLFILLMFIQTAHPAARTPQFTESDPIVLGEKIYHVAQTPEQLASNVILEGVLPQTELPQVFKTDILLKAAREQNLEIIKYMIEIAETNPLLQDENGLTAMHYVGMHRFSPKQEQIIRYLIRKAPTIINTPDNLGWTPLHQAVKDKNFCLVEYLLYNDADPDITNSSGHTPLYMAVRDNSIAIAWILLHFGASCFAGMCINEDYGNAPIQLALKLNRIEIINLIMANFNRRFGPLQNA